MGELSRESAHPPDYETALEPLTAAQTVAVVRLLIDTYYDCAQPDYSVADRAWMHSRLAEVLDG